MKSLVLFRKVCNMVYCCGLDIALADKVSIYALWVNELIPPMETHVFRLPKE